MAVGLNADADYILRGSIPSGGAGTLTDGAFANFFVGVWVYRPSTVTYANTAGGSIIQGTAGAREIRLGFNSAGANLADLSLNVIFNSGGGTGADQTFASHAGDDYLDQWVYYYYCENSTNGHIAGYILYSDLANVADSITRANDNAGSQYINSLYFGNAGAGTAVVEGYYAFARAFYGTGYDSTDALAFAASDVAAGGEWGFWPLADNTDTGDDSGNSRTLTFGGTLTSESDPVFAPKYTLQPIDQTINSGSTASFDTTVTGATSYQWQVLAASGSGGWTNVSDGTGGTTADYTTASLTTSDRGKQWRLKATNSAGDTYSNVVGVRIVSAPTSYDFSGFVIGAGA